MTVSDPDVVAGDATAVLPDLGSEPIDSIPDFVLDPGLYDPPAGAEIADPLPPADSTAVGVDDVEDAIKRARRVTLFSSSSDLGPTPLTREELRALVRSVRNATDPVIVTARFEGPDLVVNTLEYMPPRRPKPPSRSDAG